MTQVLVTNMASEGWSELREENNKLRQQVCLLEELTAERDALQEELVFLPAVPFSLLLYYTPLRGYSDMPRASLTAPPIGVSGLSSAGPWGTMRL